MEIENERGEVPYSNKERKNLVGKISELSSTEHEEIYKILQRYNIVYSRNKNGIFFNMSTLSNQIVDEISKLVTFCLSQQSALDEYDIKINECKMSNNVQRMDLKLHLETTAMQKKEHVQSVHDKLDEISMGKLSNFVERMKQDRDKIGKKKVNTSYINAKKRFTKKCGERKVEKDLDEDLTPETYLLI